MDTWQTGVLVLAHERVADHLGLSGVESGAAEDRVEGQCHPSTSPPNAERKPSASSWISLSGPC
jgi:hypothetical protein